jgi:hypothetical protein
MIDCNMIAPCESALHLNLSGRDHLPKTDRPGFAHCLLTGHSHSIVNEHFLAFNINDLIIGACGNTMKNTMFRICCYFPLMWLQSAVASI